ncbi:MAG: pyridoxal phosphate-dependent aminotransferase, partial [Hyphomicrobiaceae bacterium]
GGTGGLWSAGRGGSLVIRPNAHIATAEPYALTDLSVAEGKRLISLAQNESAVPPSPKALIAGRDALAQAGLYPDPDWTDLRAAVAEVHDVAPDSILCGAGSMELIAAIAHCYLGPDRRACSTAYGYAFFQTATRAVAARYDAVPEDNFTVSVDSLLSGLPDGTGVVFIANPGNPTGTRIPKSELTRLRDGLHDDVLLVIDEAYAEFADANSASTFDLVARGNTVVLRTFSKVYSLAGFRIGWGVFPPAIANEMRKVLNPNNVSVTSQAMAAAAMRDQAYMRTVRRETVDLRDRFAEQMRGLGLTVPESHTNFVLLRFSDAATAQRADRALRAEGVLLRGMNGYGLPDCLRATIGTATDMDFVADLLTSWRQGET